MSDDQVVQLANGKHVVIGDSKHTEWSIGVHDCAAQVGNAYSAIAKTFAEMDGHCTPEEKQFVLKIVQDMTAIFLTLLTGEKEGVASMNNGFYAGLALYMRHKKAPFKDFRNCNSPAREALAQLRQRTLAWEKEQQ